ncbi:MAG TPA: T9SS type A sorting domain-containing protein, partial [Flavobacteriales bacterium]|nr:T9SS type A sorting domain-containing protein [Flavobacteriales bacterium]
IDPLGLTASSTQFDSTIARTERMLRDRSLLMDTRIPTRTNDTAFIEVELVNLAGHKFPSGYPSRRAFVELVVTDAQGDTLFRSGGWNATYEVIGHDADIEAHHDVITQEGDAQIYEMVMGDVNDDKTTVLLRAKGPLKDNRIPPLGFSSAHFAYDTTIVAGVGPADIDFNKDELGAEGAGSDVIHYHVPVSGYTGYLRAEAHVWYQSAPPRWMAEMFEHNGAEIDNFRSMYEQADGSPVLVKTASAVDLGVDVEDLKELGIRVFPNPVRDGVLRVEGITDRVRMVEVLDMRGALVAQHRANATANWTCTLPRSGATYLLVLHTEHQRIVQRVVYP